MELIRCKDLSFGYENKTVLQGVNFSINEQDYLCVVGENGSGKSTLIKGLLSIIKPIKGQIVFADKKLSKQIGYMPQQSSNQMDFPASVFEIVLSGCLNNIGSGIFYRKRHKQLALKNIDLLGISALKNRCYRDLSKGQQQRVLLARALCSTDRILVMDEPTAGLDPKVTKELYALFRQINQEAGITIIMISHDIERSVEYASHMLHLGNKQLFFGKTEDYVQSEIGKEARWFEQL